MTALAGALATATVAAARLDGVAVSHCTRLDGRVPGRGVARRVVLGELRATMP